MNDDTREQSVKRTNIILAALRHLQSSLAAGTNLTYLDEIIAVESIELDAIDAICESINFGDDSPESLERTFVLEGRISGSDEDSIAFIEAPTLEVANARFEQFLRDEKCIPDDIHPEIYVTYCETVSAAMSQRIVVPSHVPFTKEHA